MCSQKEYHKKNRRTGVFALKNTLKNPPIDHFLKRGGFKPPHAIGFLRTPPPRCDFLRSVLTKHFLPPKFVTPEILWRILVQKQPLWLLHLSKKLSMINLGMCIQNFPLGMHVRVR